MMPQAVAVSVWTRGRADVFPFGARLVFVSARRRCLIPSQPRLARPRKQRAVCRFFLPPALFEGSGMCLGCRRFFILLKGEML